MPKIDFAHGLSQKPVNGGHFVSSIRDGGNRLILAGSILAVAMTGAMAQESGMPTQSGGQEPEMPGNSAPAAPKPAQSGDGSPQMLEAEENGVKLSITCADNQPAKDCAAAAEKMLQRWQGG